jgi:hypothetical protein
MPNLDNQVQVIIRPQLVPFLFKEFEGKQAHYDHRTVKSVVFLPSSSITSYLYTQIDYKKNSLRQDKFLFWLMVDHKSPKTFSGQVFIERNGVKESLIMSEQKVRDFNNLLEDMFRMAMIFYVDACHEIGKLSIPKAIEKFIEKYDLYEVGFDIETLRVLYFREKKTPNLYRFQSKSANRVMNFA